MRQDRAIEPRSIWPSFQRLRTESDNTIGVAPFAFVSTASYSISAVIRRGMACE